MKIPAPGALSCGWRKSDKRPITKEIGVIPLGECNGQKTNQIRRDQRHVR